MRGYCISGHFVDLTNNAVESEIPESFSEHVVMPFPFSFSVTNQAKSVSTPAVTQLHPISLLIHRPSTCCPWRALYFYYQLHYQVVK